MPEVSTFHIGDDREIPTVFVQMDLPIGYSISSTTPSIIPFVAVTTEADTYNKYYHRWQLPLEPAFATTTHKMQGATEKYGAVVDPNPGTPFTRGLDYIAVSRPTELNNLTLLAPLTPAHFNGYIPERHLIRTEYDRLRSLHTDN